MHYTPPDFVCSNLEKVCQYKSQHQKKLPSQHKEMNACILTPEYHTHIKQITSFQNNKKTVSGLPYYVASVVGHLSCL